MGAAKEHDRCRVQHQPGRPPAVLSTRRGVCRPADCRGRVIFCFSLGEVLLELIVQRTVTDSRWCCIKATQQLKESHLKVHDCPDSAYALATCVMCARTAAATLLLRQRSTAPVSTADTYTIKTLCMIKYNSITVCHVNSLLSSFLSSFRS